jgi:hypothetical protein
MLVAGRILGRVPAYSFRLLAPIGTSSGARNGALSSLIPEKQYRRRAEPVLRYIEPEDASRPFQLCPLHRWTFEAISESRNRQDLT